MMNKYVCACALIAALAVGCNSGSNSASNPSSPTSVASTTNSPSSQACSAVTGSHMVASAALASASSPASPKSKRLHGHLISAQVAAKDQGKSDETKELPVSIVLSLTNQAELENTLEQIYRPGSPNYRRFLTPEEFRTRFAPSDAQVAQVTNYLQQQGLYSVTADQNGLVVHAVGSVGNLNRTFNTEIHDYSDAKGRSFRAPNNEPEVPAELPIQSVHGMQSLSVAHNYAHAAPGESTSAAPRAGSGPSGGYSPSDIRTAYNVPSTLDGSGQTLALYELDGYNASDITQYEQQFGLPATPLQNVLIDGAAGSAGGGAAEVTLDIELMIALAPKATKIIVYEGPNTDQGMLDTYSKIASDNLAKSVSTSWGDSEDGVTASFIQSENTIFMEMAAQGQTIYSAAGDVGAKDNGSTLSVDDPSAQPYVVAVGGTTLSTGTGGTYQSETTWNDGSGASGGGVSSVWTIPTWQQNLGTAANQGSTKMRNIPDVALHSDINTGYAIYTGGSWGVWGGTSCAAPLWAAFNALLNQQRAQNGLGPVGYITPLLYALGRGGNYAQDFHDISDGSTNQYYPAVSGYDDATGWGSFNAVHLIADLSALPTLTPTSQGSTALPAPSCP